MTLTLQEKISLYLTGAKVEGVVQNDSGGIDLLLADEEGTIFHFSGSAHDGILTELLQVQTN